MTDIVSTGIDDYSTWAKKWIAINFPPEPKPERFDNEPERFDNERFDNERKNEEEEDCIESLLRELPATMTTSQKSCVSDVLFMNDAPRGWNEFFERSLRVYYACALIAEFAIVGMQFVYPTMSRLTVGSVAFLAISLRLFSPFMSSRRRRKQTAEYESTKYFLLNYLALVENIAFLSFDTRRSLCYLYAVVVGTTFVVNSGFYLLHVKRDAKFRAAARKTLDEREEREMMTKSSTLTFAKTFLEEREIVANWDQSWDHVKRAITGRDNFDAVFMSLCLVLDFTNFEIVWFYPFVFNRFALDNPEPFNNGKRVVETTTTNELQRRFIEAINEEETEEGAKPASEFVVWFYYLASFTFLILTIVYNAINGNDNFTLNVMNWIVLILLAFIVVVKDAYTMFFASSKMSPRWITLLKIFGRYDVHSSSSIDTSS